MDPMELLKLLGIVIVVVGFACKLDSILVIMVAAVATALVAGMDPVSFLETMGSSFVSNRSMCVFIMTFVITGYLGVLMGLASVAVAPAFIATIAAIVYYQVLDRKDTKRYHSEQLSMDGDK